MNPMTDTILPAGHRVSRGETGDLHFDNLVLMFGDVVSDENL